MMNGIISKQTMKNKKPESYMTNVGSSLERIRKARALNCGADYIGIDSLVMKMLPFIRQAGLY